jgi:integrase
MWLTGGQFWLLAIEACCTQAQAAVPSGYGFLGNTRMAKVKMTDRFVTTVKESDGGRQDYFDTVTRGLVLRVGGGGRKAWCLFYTSPRDGKRARIGLGPYPAISLAEARGRALEATSHVASGNDPRRTLKATAAMTVSDLARAYLADPRKQRLRTVDEINRRLRRDVIPVIGEIRIVELGRRDVRDVFEPIERNGKPVAARRAFEDIRAMVHWAVEHEFLPHNPIEGMKGPDIKAPREWTLSENEIAVLWAALPKVLPQPYQHVVQLCLVTGQRLGEVSGMRRGELHLERAEWHLPGSRTKNGHPHVVPLSDLAAEIVNAALTDADDSSFVFPHHGGPLPSGMVSWAISKSGEKFGLPHWTVHDLRRTALTGMAGLGVAPIVLGHVANHRSTTQAGVTLGVYVQHEYVREKREALNVWAARLEAIVGGGDAAKVLPMRRL